MKPRYSREVEIAKFNARVDRSGDCWLWTAGCTGEGRGVMHWRGTKTLAYRISWELANGAPPPADMLVCHRCDNGLCVRPDHLFLGDDLANARDAIAKGRASRPPLHVGATHPRARHSDTFVADARRGVAANGLASLAAVADQLALPRATLHSWVTGKTRVSAGGPISDGGAR